MHTLENAALIIAVCEQTQLRSCVGAHAGKGGRKKKFVLYFLFKAFTQRQKVGDKHMRIREDEFDRTRSHIWEVSIVWKI